MPIGKASDFKIYEPEFYGGMVEAITQNVNVFNAASNGALRLVSAAQKGHYDKESFFKDIANLVTRRDITSVSAATDLAMTQDEIIAVKANRKIGPVTQTMDAFKKLGANPSEMSLVFGRMVGSRVVQEMVNTSVAALSSAVGGQAGLIHTIAANGTMTHAALVSGMAKFGDAAGRLRAWVMHSKPYFDLFQQSITDKITNVADVVIVQGTPATLGKPVIVTDIPGLLVSGTPNLYHTLGLVEDAVTVNESEERNIISQVVTGLENLAVRIQGEYAYTIKLKGYKWDVANGGANPASAALVTASNWDVAVSDNRDTAGIKIISG